MPALLQLELEFTSEISMFIMTIAYEDSKAHIPNGHPHVKCHEFQRLVHVSDESDIACRPLASYQSEIMISNCSVLKERVSNAGGRFYVDYFDWSDIRIAMHYT